MPCRVRGVPYSEQLRIVERFTRVGHDTMQYEITIDDPANYTAPWKIAYPLARDDQYQMFEYACHEGNHAIELMLRGARVQEQASEELAIHDTEDVAVRVLEPGNLQVLAVGDVQVALQLQARHVVVLEGDALRFQRAHFALDVVDRPGDARSPCSCPRTASDRR